jgi:tRNA(Ile)-lysidine synthase
MPALERDAPGVTARMLALSALAAEAEEHWKSELRELVKEAVLTRDGNGFTLARGVLLGYHPAVRARVIRYLCEAGGVACSRSGTRLASEFISTGQSGTAVEIARGVTLTREFDILMVRLAARAAVLPDVAVPIPFAESGSAEAVIGGRRIGVRWAMVTPDASMTDADEIECDGVSFASAALQFPLELRGWQPGDHIRMSYGSKKLKNLFVERRIERSRRPAVPVLVESGSGSVLWMPGIARAATAAPVSGAPVFQIRIEE